MDSTIRATNVAVSPRSLRRDIGLSGLLFASLGGIIGSGWLFGALYSAQSAGPAALVSWVIGGLAVLLLAFIYAELSSTFPLAGGVARFPHLTHGSLVGYSIGWVVFLGYIAVAPIEVEAALQYATNYIPWLTTSVNGVAILTAPGYAVAALLLLVFVILNLVGVKLMANTNTGIGIWKLVIPTLTFIIILAFAFHPSNLTAFGGFLPYGVKGVLSAISSSGIIFSYLGFRQAVELAGEGKNPQKNIPFALIGSVLIGIVIYVFLQLALLGAVSPSSLASGWAKLSYPGTFGPFAGLATTLGISWLAILLYIDAVVSPGGTGLIYISSTSRLVYALAKNRYFPKWLTSLSERGVPIWSIIVSFVLGLIVFLPFPGWQTLVGFISSAVVLSYGIGPVVLMSLRRQQPDLARPFRLGAAGFWAPIAFIISNLIVYWTGWNTDWKLFVAILLGYVVMAVVYALTPSTERPRLNLGNGIWIIVYFIGLAIISYLGSFGGGLGILPFGIDLLVVAVYSLIIYFWAVGQRLNDAESKEQLQELEA
ncbi:MAG: APC family permease [Chloroflexi bacterium]|nr:APC family permease [Chloroflexota bacterium]